MKFKVSHRLKQALELLDQGNPPVNDANIFGAAIGINDANLALIPVPWEVSVSYGEGTRLGPEAIVKASYLMDLHDHQFGKIFEFGIAMDVIDERIKEMNSRMRPKASTIIEGLDKGDTAFDEDIRAIDVASEFVNNYVYEKARGFLKDGKLVGLVGGDHSCPYGLIKALAEDHGEGFGILHFDAHHDLRCAYEGFQYSHASIMYNVLADIEEVKKLVSVGVRDYSSGEKLRASEDAKITTFYAEDIYNQLALGQSLKEVAAAIITNLPDKVYVSFDIDVLERGFAPATGTPVPGGLDFREAVYILHRLAASGKEVIGFDLCEVSASPGSDWDANVGARILYKLCGVAIAGCCKE